MLLEEEESNDTHPRDVLHKANAEDLSAKRVISSVLERVLCSSTDPEPMKGI